VNKLHKNSQRPRQDQTGVKGYEQYLNVTLLFSCGYSSKVVLCSILLATNLLLCKCIPVDNSNSYKYIIYQCFDTDLGFGIRQVLCPVILLWQTYFCKET